MPLSSSMILQLGVLLFLAIILFIIAYRLPQVVSSVALLVMIPVQPIDTRYASANVLLSYVVFLAMLMRKGEVRLPLLPHFLFLLFCYLISMSMVHKALYVQHGVYMLAVVSSYLVFCVAYDLTLRLGSTEKIVNVFLWMNVLVAIYCGIQMAVGPGERVVIFGLQEMSMIPARDDNRLTGPFRAVGVTAEFFVIMIFVLLHRLLLSSGIRYRWPLIMLAVVNLALLVATGNRGGFLTLLGGSALLIWFFRKQLGLRKVIQLATGGTVALALAGTVIVSYTDFGRLFERLEGTTLEEGIPDTRQVTWPLAWEKIKQRPIFGHGPRFEMDGAADGLKYPGYEYQPYPHSLYLFLLATIGVVGTLAFLVFLLTPLLRCWKSAARAGPDQDATFVKLGAVILIVILVDQVKVEFMRIALTDYWHFIFALLGMFTAASDRLKATSIAAHPGRHREALEPKVQGI